MNARRTEERAPVSRVTDDWSRRSGQHRSRSRGFGARRELDQSIGAALAEPSPSATALKRFSAQQRRSSWSPTTPAEAPSAPVGIVGALTLGSGAGAAIGAVSGHVSGGMERADLKDVGEALDGRQAG